MIKRTNKRSVFPKGSFLLPIHTATIVPSTTNTDKTVSVTEFKKRINDTRKFLSKLFGGYTSFEVKGGYTTGKGKLVKEKAAMVIAYAQKEDFKKKKQRWFSWVKRKGRAWGQDDMGIIVENDMAYIKCK